MSTAPSYREAPTDPQLQVPSRAPGTPGAGASGEQGLDQEVEPRTIRLTLTRVNPLSVMKVSFLVSVALGIAGVVATALLWMLINGMGVFGTINDTLAQWPSSDNARLDVYSWVGFGRVMSFSVVVGVLNVLVMTAIATLAAFIYNLCASLVGGVRVTLSDD